MGGGVLIAEAKAVEAVIRDLPTEPQPQRSDDGPAYGAGRFRHTPKSEQPPATDCPDCHQKLSGDEMLDREVHGRCHSQGAPATDDNEGYAPNRCEIHNVKYFNVCPECADLISVAPATDVKEQGSHSAQEWLWCESGENYGYIINHAGCITITGCKFSREVGKAIADAHNAELEAERETKDNYKRETMELARLLDSTRQQLKAERDKVEAALQVLRDLEEARGCITNNERLAFLDEMQRNARTILKCKHFLS